MRNTPPDGFVRIRLQYFTLYEEGTPITSLMLSDKKRFSKADVIETFFSCANKKLNEKQINKVENNCFIIGVFIPSLS